VYNKRFQLLIFLALFSFLLKNNYSQPLKNNSIELKLSYSPGITNGTQIYAGIPGIKGIFTVKNNFGGFGGKISFNHYISKNVSLSITSGIISANSIVTIFKTQTISIIPLLMGAKYFPNLLSYNTAIRPVSSRLFRHDVRISIRYRVVECRCEDSDSIRVLFRFWLRFNIWFSC